MSARTVTAVQRFLTAETRDAIEQAGVNLDPDAYASNVENALRIRGEHGLANRMLEEIEIGLRDHMLERLAMSERPNESD